MKKPEEIYLNLANCSEEELKEVRKIIIKEKHSENTYFLPDFEDRSFLVFYYLWDLISYKHPNKTEVNFKQFKEIMGGDETHEQEYNRLCKEATELQSLNISERMDIANNIFKDFSLLKKNKSILHEQLFSAMEMYLKKCIETKRQIK